MKSHNKTKTEDFSWRDEVKMVPNLNVMTLTRYEILFSLLFFENYLTFSKFVCHSHLFYFLHKWIIFFPRKYSIFSPDILIIVQKSASAYKKGWSIQVFDVYIVVNHLLILRNLYGESYSERRNWMQFIIRILFIQNFVKYPTIIALGSGLATTWLCWLLILAIGNEYNMRPTIDVVQGATLDVFIMSKNTLILFEHINGK